MYVVVLLVGPFPGKPKVAGAPIGPGLGVFSIVLLLMVLGQFECDVRSIVCRINPGALTAAEPYLQQPRGPAPHKHPAFGNRGALGAVRPPHFLSLPPPTPKGLLRSP